MADIHQTGAKNLAVGVNHGHITINYNGKEIKRFLTPHPFDPPLFIGRKEGLKSVRDKLFGGQNFLMLVNGQGGIGKTSFAAKYWKEYQDEYAHLAFLFVENGIGDALLGLADGLGAEFPPEMPQEQRLEVLAKHIAGLNKPCLLVLDNANNETELNAHARLLRRFGNFHILITSRLADFEHTEKHFIGALDKKDALTVFRTHYKAFEESETELFYEIFESIGGNTLLVELFAKNIDHFNNKLKKKYSLQNLLDDLQKGLTKLSQSKEVNTAYQAKGAGLRTESIESIVLAMYDLTELDDSEKAILSVFAVLPAENIGFEVLENFLKEDPEILRFVELIHKKIKELVSVNNLKVWLQSKGLNLTDEKIEVYLKLKKSSFENLDQKLIDLSQKGWIEYDESGASFKCSPVVQDITLHQNKERLFGDCEGMMIFLVNELNWQDNQNYHQNNYQITTLYCHYSENVVNALPVPHKYYSLLLERIGKLHEIKGDIYKSYSYYKTLNETNKKQFIQNPENCDYKKALVVSFSKFGKISAILNNLEDALDCFLKSNQLAIELYKEYPEDTDIINKLSVSYLKLGEFFYHNDLKMALSYFEYNNHLNSELYKTYPENIRFKNSLAISFSKLGDTHTLLGNLDMALDFFQTETNLFEELCVVNPKNPLLNNGLVDSYAKLGNTYTSLGNATKAFYFLEKGMDLATKLYEEYADNVDFKNGLAALHFLVGRFFQKQNNLPQAKSNFLESQKLYKELVRDFPEVSDFQTNLRVVEELLSEL